MRIITIGRDLSNDIIIEDERVSRHHLQLVERDGVYQAVDLDSTNGTFVNGRRIQGAVSLSRHDTIRIGNTDLLWQAYFEKDDVSKSAASSHPQPERPARRSRGRKSRTWPILITVVAILVIAVGVNTWFNYQSGKSLDERASALEKRKSEQLSQTKEPNSQEEFQRLYEEAILAKAKNAKEAQERAEEAKRRADSLQKKAEREAQIAQNNAASAKSTANQANNDKEAAIKAKDDAIREQKNAARKAEEAQSKADSLQKKAEDAQQQLTLTKEFYKACAGWKKSHYEALCKQQNWPVAKGEDVQSIVETKFEQASTTEQANIINAIGKLKKEAPAEEASAPADTSETKSSENNH